MKKLFVACGLALLGLQNVSAQAIDPHFGVGVGVGTTGIAIDVSGTLNSYVGARFGVDIMPEIKIGTELDLGIEDKTNGTTIEKMTQYIDDLNTRIDQWNTLNPGNRIDRVDKSKLPNQKLPNQIDVEGKFTNTQWHLLFDIYPFGDASSFHATVGAYFAPKKIIKVYNKEDGFLEPINQWNRAIVQAQENPTSLLYTKVVEPNNLQMIGAELGDYFITPNPTDNGNVEASIKVGGFRPYLGIGIGRAVPKGRIGCQLDLGVQFWGSPEVYAPTYDKKSTASYNDRFSESKLEESNAGSDAGKVLKTISKISVYPVLNFRLVGRIF